MLEGITTTRTLSSSSTNSVKQQVKAGRQTADSIQCNKYNTKLCINFYENTDKGVTDLVRSQWLLRKEVLKNWALLLIFPFFFLVSE